MVPFEGGFPGGISGKQPACQCRRQKRSGLDSWEGKIPWRCNAGDIAQAVLQFLGQEDPLEKEMATHCSILAWKTPWTVHGVTRVWHDLVTKQQKNIKTKPLSFQCLCLLGLGRFWLPIPFHRPEESSSEPMENPMLMITHWRLP